MARHRSNHGRAPSVLHVITPSRMAGAETFLARLLRRTAQSALEREVLAPRSLLLAATHCISNVSRANADMRAAGMNFEALRIGGKVNLLAVPRLRAAARRHGANLLHSHLSSASWWCGWLEKLGGPPSIGHVHGFTSALWHRQQSHLIACSAAVKTDLIANGISAERITVMHYPVDTDDQRATRSPASVRAELGVAVDAPVIGTFAHLSLKKGYRELIRAAELVLNHVPNAQFWCFGEGPLRDELTAYARAVRIGDRFRMFGFRRDVPELMRAVDVMCLPSHREPFGLVYVEAALAEKPVIACDAGGAPEIIKHGVTGLLVPPPGATANQVSGATGSASVLNSNVPALADAILTLLDNRDQSAAMGRRGRQLALDRFGWPNYLTRLHELYERVLSSRHASTQLARQAA